MQAALGARNHRSVIASVIAKAYAHVWHKEKCPHEDGVFRPTLAQDHLNSERFLAST